MEIWVFTWGMWLSWYLWSPGLESQNQNELGAVVHICHAGTWEAETRRLVVEGHPELHREFEASSATGDPVSAGK